jgi:hypothetical protein
MEQQFPGFLAPSTPEADDNGMPGVLQDILIRRAIEQRLIADADRRERQRILLGSVSAAEDRLSALSVHPLLPMNIQFNLADTAQWLATVADTLQNGNPTLEDMEIQAAALKVRLQETQTLLQASLPEDAADPSTRDPSALIAKMDRVFEAIPSVFELLKQENIGFTQHMVAPLLAAKESYDTVRPACLASADSCARLAEVIVPLEELMNAIKDALRENGREDLELQINAMVQ